MIGLALLALLAPASQAFAETDVDGRYWPTGVPTPAPNQPGCVIVTEPDPTPLTSELQQTVEETARLSGKPVTVARQADEICFDSFGEYVEYMERQNGAQDSLQTGS